MNRSADQELKKLLNDALMASDIAWWEWDIQSNQVISNELKTTMLGYKTEDFRDVGYQSYTDLLHPDDYDRTMQAMRDHLEGRAPIYQIDYRIRRADGIYTWYMDRGYIIERDEEGRPLKLRGVVIDLGETMREKSRDQAIFRLIRRKLPAPGNNEQSVVICSSCKKIKITNSIWVTLDSTFERAFVMEISHGICPECADKLYPEIDLYG
jgi:PAS domain S-box-containing protein